ncbi:efflux transporter outer membrane subunit [Methylocella sp. CPCC 101449]|uniref:efflux transporter outer membrane subunit n=1 Tax=Methylocella sp. CPCC 101449 TaxID=2987531 RepID=UPI00288CE05F|nr:efflux transporter outer membrane subunit [Methylocella sp. CPCC 101449]MDT2019146.1 efflux transporter outer membrane subunit [Methylocella sp. CPCC 101449]
MLTKSTTAASLAALLTAVSLGGCQTLAPDYVQPAMAAPSAWPQGPAFANAKVASATTASDIGWAEFFTDAKLKKLIALAIDNNRDLRVSALNIAKARATYQAQNAQLLPHVDLSGSMTAQRQPGTSGGTQNVISRSGSFGVGTSSFEIDFFGRLQSLSQQQLENYLASDEAQRTTYLTLVSDVANAYATLAADKDRLRLAENTLKSQQTSLDLTRRSLNAGTSTDLAVAQAQTSVESARGDVSTYTAQVAQDVNALALYLGASVPPELMPSSLSAIAAPRPVPVGLPSDVLLRRPDILEAEHKLKGANANIGAARAAFFPSITLTANTGTSQALSRLFKAGSGAWVFSPNVNLPIFDGGMNLANLRGAETDREIYVAQYEKAVQSAFREVVDALATRGTIGPRVSSQTALVDAYQRSYDLSMTRFREGIDNYLSVLQSQQSLYAAQQNLITLRLSRMTNAATLYKVLGGGWMPGSTGSKVAGL